MVAPLIGLLGAAALSPLYGNYMRGMQGRYNQRAMQGIDMNDPAAVRQGLFEGGMLSGQDFSQQQQTAFQGEQNRVNAIRRAQISAGPAYARVALDRAKYQDQIAQQQARTDALRNLGMPDAYAAIPSLANNWMANYGANVDTTAGMSDEERLRYEILRQAEMDIRINEAYPRDTTPEIVLQDAEIYGEPWLTMDREDRGLVRESRETRDDLASAVQFMNSASLADKAVSREEIGAIHSKFIMAAMPMIAEEFNAKAMTDDEYARFEEMAGDPTKLMDWFGENRGRVSQILRKAEQRYAGISRDFGLNAVGLPEPANPNTGGRLVADPGGPLAGQGRAVAPLSNNADQQDLLDYLGLD